MCRVINRLNLDLLDGTINGLAMEKEKMEDDLTYRIIGCTTKVHAFLGNGFQEIIRFSAASPASGHVK